MLLAALTGKHWSMRLGVFATRLPTSQPSYRIGPGQVDAKATALAWGGGDAQLSARAGDQGLADRQAKSGALGLLGGVEWIENTLAHLLCDAVAGILDMDRYTLRLVKDPDRQRAAPGHRVHCVEDQVDDHLLQFGACHQH